MIMSIIIVVILLLATIKLTFDSFQWLKQLNFIANVEIPMKYEHESRWLPYSEIDPEKSRWLPYREIEEQDEEDEEDEAFGMPDDYLEK